MRMGAIVLDSDNSDKLSDFYQKLLDWEKEVQYLDGDKWIIVYDDKKEGMPLVFQEIANYVRPKWPAGSGQQQMIHLDFYVNAGDLENEVKHALSCGAELSDTQLSEKWKVLIDPAGHPFCIIPIPLT